MKSYVILSYILSVPLLSACGGGGSSNGSVSADQDNSNTSLNRLYPTRLDRIEYDFENNGITDGIEYFSYNSEGKLEMTVFEYTGDGTQDLFLGESYEGAMRTEVIYSYDDMGRVTDINTSIIANTSPEASIRGSSGATNKSFVYDGESEYPVSKTESIFNESGSLTSRYTVNYMYNSEGYLFYSEFAYDPSVSSSAIDNPAFFHHQEYDYFEGFASESNFNYLDEFFNATIVVYGSDGLITSQFVSDDHTLSSTPPPSASVVEFSYNNRNCLAEINIAAVSEFGVFENKTSTQIVYDSQDRPINAFLDIDLDGGVDGKRTYYYEEASGTHIPFSGGLSAALFSNQGLETDCLTD
jgi:hypothetical protein